jgi:hypothetical protein
MLGFILKEYIFKRDVDVFVAKKVQDAVKIVVLKVYII